MRPHIKYLKKLGACSVAVDWAKQYDSLQEAWDVCECGDWMLWLKGAQPDCPRQELVLAACECARLVLPYVPDGETRPLAAIETAEDWARGGKSTLEQVRNAANAAYAATAAANAAFAAFAAANASYAVHGKTPRECADIARKYWPEITMPEN